ncbi:MAG: IS3 family transposase [Actinobacteria bacterium]|nr:IS3 family transposase [Actinomycetota bacterium]
MATLKTELIHRSRFKTSDEARSFVFRYIKGFYNPKRKHSALDYKCPAEYERMLTETEEAAEMTAATS